MELFVVTLTNYAKKERYCTNVYTRKNTRKLGSPTPIGLHAADTVYNKPMNVYLSCLSIVINVVLFQSSAVTQH